MKCGSHHCQSNPILVWRKGRLSSCTGQCGRWGHRDTYRCSWHSCPQRWRCWSWFASTLVWVCQDSGGVRKPPRGKTGTRSSPTLSSSTSQRCCGYFCRGGRSDLWRGLVMLPGMVGLQSLVINLTALALHFPHPVDVTLVEWVPHNCTLLQNWSDQCQVCILLTLGGAVTEVSTEKSKLQLAFLEQLNS